MCKGLNNTGSVNLTNFNFIYSVTGTNYQNNAFNKNSYLRLAKNIVAVYEQYGNNPVKIQNYNNTFSFDDCFYMYTKIFAYKFTHNNQLPSTIKISALYNHDYSNQKDALLSTTTNPLTVKINHTKVGQKYNITIKTNNPQAKIYYTLDGSIPTTQSTQYTESFLISGSTIINYYAVSTEGQTPKMIFGITKATTPYIIQKPNTSQNQYIIKLSCSENSIIYYTINGTKPTTKSSVYNNYIKINNLTRLQFFSVKQYNNKISPVYFYQIKNAPPILTIINKTEVRNNQQEIYLIGNKPSKIYYTTDMSTPTNKSNNYEPLTKLPLSIKTTLKAIIIDYSNIQSQTITYQPPQIITPPTTIIKALTGLENNTQKIQFITNRKNTTIYYTTDGSNPITSSKTKTAKENTQITIHKTNILKYYSKDEQNYTSNIITYTTPKNTNERPIITVFNTTQLYSDGTQKIMIQSNQPGLIQYISIINNNESHKMIYTGEISINKNELLEIYSYSTTNKKYSTIIEYTNGKNQTIMKYNYKIYLSNRPRYIGINSIDYNLIDTSTINSYIYFNPTTKTTINLSTKDDKLRGITIYNTDATTLIEINDKVYENLSHISVLYNTFDGMEIITIMNNNQTEYTLYVSYDKLISYNSEIIKTNFKANNDISSITRNEIISHKSISNSNGFEVVQSYIITNQIITQEILNEWINRNKSYTIGMQKAAYGTALTALTTLHFNDMITAYYAYYFNITYSRQDDVTILTGVNINELTYTTTNDPTTGNTIYSGTDPNKFYFRLMTTLMHHECERMAIQLSGQKSTTGLIEFYKEIKQYKDLTFTLDNNTHLMNITTSNPDYYIELDMNTGIARIYLKTETGYLGLYFEEYIKGASGTIGEGGCYHNEKTENTLNALKDILEEIQNICDTIQNIEDDIENTAITLLDELFDDPVTEITNFILDEAGSTAITAGLLLFFSSGGTAAPISAILIFSGSVLCFNAAGGDSIEDVLDFEIMANTVGSIILASVGGPELKVFENVGKVLVKKTLKENTKVSIITSIEQSGFYSLDNAISAYTEGKVKEWSIHFGSYIAGYDKNAN